MGKLAELAAARRAVARLNQVQCADARLLAAGHLTAALQPSIQFHLRCLLLRPPARLLQYSGTLRLGEGTPSLDAETPVEERLPWEHITGASHRW